MKRRSSLAQADYPFSINAMDESSIYSNKIGCNYCLRKFYLNSDLNFNFTVVILTFEKIIFLLAASLFSEVLFLLKIEFYHSQKFD